jgi:hypothetical protein
MANFNNYNFYVLFITKNKMKKLRSRLFKGTFFDISRDFFQNHFLLLFGF